MTSVPMELHKGSFVWMDVSVTNVFDETDNKFTAITY